MTSMWRTLVVTLALVVACGAAPSPGRATGTSNAAITFGTQSSQPRWSFGGRKQEGAVSTTSEQKSTGDGGQTNTGSATGVSVQQQTGLGGATQITNNAAAIEAAQAAGGGSGGDTSLSSNNQVIIQSTQNQQNVDGTLVNINEGHQGTVVLNVNDPSGALIQQQVINNKPKGETTAQSARCRYWCKYPQGRGPYCCDDGSNNSGAPGIHGGACPPVRILANRNPFIQKCAHDGQCAPSDKCCFDVTFDRHICKTAD